jgi:hypothetical protein
MSVKAIAMEDGVPVIIEALDDDSFMAFVCAGYIPERDLVVFIPNYRRVFSSGGSPFMGIEVCMN